jgi:SagB-type dehydrogenase family enzyme
MPNPEIIKLPQPRFSGPVSVEEALLTRRSVRNFSRDPLTVDELTQLLWAAQGVTHARGYRTAPSAGALYPLELYAIVGHMVGLAAGVYRFRCVDHALEPKLAGDLRPRLCAAALSQRFIERAPVVFLFTAVYERMSGRYGRRGARYVDMEAGHAAQNLSLQAVALGLASVVVGAFGDGDVCSVVGLPREEEPLYLVPVGK